MITKSLIDADVRALTLANPWAHAITSPDPDPKRVENRSWSAPQSVDTFLIHAGKAWDRNAPASLILGAYGTPVAAIVAVARLGWVCGATVGPYASDCGCGRWAVPGQYHWRISDDLFVLPKPVPARGFQKLWKPTSADLEAVKEQIQ